jgi:hypothetical protein
MCGWPPCECPFVHPWTLLTVVNRAEVDAVYRFCLAVFILLGVYHGVELQVTWRFYVQLIEELPNFCSWN